MFVVFEKQDPPELSPEETAEIDEQTRIASLYKFIGCRVEKEPGDKYVCLSVTDEAYGRFMLDPSMSVRYLPKVHEFVTTGIVSLRDVDLPIVKKQAVHDETREIDQLPPTQTLPVLAPIQTLNPLLPSLLHEDDTADVVVEIYRDKIRRIDKDPNKVRPAITVYGLDPDFPLNVMFEAVLSQRKTEMDVDLRSNTTPDIWILNPKHETTYGLTKKE